MVANPNNASASRLNELAFRAQNLARSTRAFEKAPTREAWVRLEVEHAELLAVMAQCISTLAGDLMALRARVHGDGNLKAWDPTLR